MNSREKRIKQLKQKSNELMRSGDMAAAIKLYNKAWELERGIRASVQIIQTPREKVVKTCFPD